MEAIKTGEITEIFEAKQVTEKFKKRDFAIKTEEQYPNEILFQMIQGGCDNLDTYNVGDKVKVHFNVGGRKKADRYYNSLTVTKLEFNI